MFLLAGPATNALVCMTLVPLVFIWGGSNVVGLLNPLRTGFYAIDLWTWKVLKRLIALPLMTLLISTVALCFEHPVFMGLAAVTGLIGLLALLGHLLRHHRLGRTRPLAIPAYFCMVNVAAVCAATNALAGRRIDRWSPQRTSADAGTPRPTTAAGADEPTAAATCPDAVNMEVAGS